MIKKIFLLFLLLGVMALPTMAQRFNKPKMDSLFDAVAAHNANMGSIVISKKGKVIYSRQVGYSNITNDVKTPASAQTKYRIGSISKMFTATIVFQLMKEGKLKLNTPLSDYYPELPKAKQITIANLLQHRSGLHNFTEDVGYMAWFTKPKTHQEMLTTMKGIGTDFEPGTKASYSNSNYVVLSYIIEKICKKPYSEVLQERIVSKLGLKDTYYGGKTNLANNEAYSYSYKNDTWKQEPETDMSIPSGAGAIVSTPSDLVKFIDALFAYKLVDSSSLVQMKTQVDKHGMGMFEIPFYKKIAYGHSGGIDGFTSMLAYFPEDSITVAYCSNGSSKPMNDILLGVLLIYYNAPHYDIPTFKSLALKSEELDKYLGVYTSSEMPLAITVTKDSASLFAQATGQAAFPLEAISKDVFTFDLAHIKMEFKPDTKEMTLNQGGAVYHFAIVKQQ